MVDTHGVERGRTALDPMGGIAEAQQIFGEIGTILPGDVGATRRFESCTAMFTRIKRREAKSFIIARTARCLPLAAGPLKQALLAPSR